MDTKLTREQIGELEAGDRVRIVTKGGATYQGLIMRIGRSSYSTEHIVLHGKTFTVYSHEFYDAGGEDIDHPRHEPTAVELRDIIADAECSPLLGKPRAHSIAEVVTGILGFDPGSHAGGSGYAVRTKEAARNEFISMTYLKRLLAQMVDDDILVAVKGGGGGTFRQTQDQKYIAGIGGGGTGWVTRRNYDESVAQREAEAADLRISVLREEARGIVADRHQDEVEAVVAELIAKSAK